MFEETLRVDPLEPLNWAQMAWRHLGAGRVDEVSRSARRVLDLSDPGSPVRTYGAYALALAGERQPALMAFEQVAVALPGTVYGSMSLFLNRALQGDVEGSVTQVTPELEQAAHWTEYLALFLADGYSLVGQRENALRCLRTAVDRGFLNFPYLTKPDPFLEALRGEIAFAGLMQDVRRQWVAFES